MSTTLTTGQASEHHIGLPGSQAESIPPVGQGGGLTFKYVVAAVRSNLQLIGLILLATLALTVIVSLLETPRYAANSKIQINNTSSRVLKSQDDGQDDDSAAQASDSDRFLKTQVGVLESRSLALRVVQRLGLMNNARFYAAQGRDLPAGSTPEGVRRALVFKLISKNLEVTLPHDSRIVTISYESNDAKLSADIANAFASEFIQLNLQRKFDSSSYAREFLEGQLTQTKGKLEESEKALNAYTRAAGIIRTSTPTGADDKSSGQASQSVVTASLLQLNQAANDAKARRIAAEGRWKAINSGPLMSATEVVSNMGVNNLINQRAQIQASLEEDRANHLDDYPTVKAKKQSLASINALIQSAAQNIRNAIHADYTATVQAESDLEHQVDALKSQTLNEQDRNVQYGLLSREVDTNRQVYEGLLQRYKELNASAGITISNIAIIDTADAPPRPTSPVLWRNFAVGLALGIVLAIAAVAIKDQFDDSIRIPEEIESKLGMALLGVIPRSRKARLEDELVDPKSSISEAYNSLRGSLMYSTPDGMPRSMLVTSAQAAEGKSTTTFAIAIGLARMGKRVILIDADMRRPTMHRQIDYDNQVGLSTLLTSLDSVANVAQSTGQQNLSIITSGPVPPSPTELISGNRMREVLGDALEHCDVVLIDSPPVLGLADAPMMAALVQGVIFVVEADRSRHGSLKTALRRLRTVRPNVLGGVLSKFDPLRAANRYSSYYGYEYYQYEYSHKEEK